MSNNTFTIAGSVGRDGINDRSDVMIVQALLNKIRAKPEVSITGEYDDNLGDAIGEFTKICIDEPIYRINPGDEIFNLLLRTANPKNLKLEEIKLMSIDKGGYYINYEKDFIPPNEYKVMLYLAGEKGSVPEDAIDITKPAKSKGTGYMDKKKLLKLLDIIGSKNLWSKEGSEKPNFCAYFTRDSNIISSSNPQPLSCPIKPYEGKIRLDLAHIDPPMYYVGRIDGGKLIFEGRRFHYPPIDGKYYFIYKEPLGFETDYKKRGFGCIGYVTTVLSADPKFSPPKFFKTSKELATHLGAKECELNGCKMNEVEGDKVRQFFEKNKSGTFIVWSEKHVVLVVDGVVHQFNVKNGKPGDLGYFHDSVEGHKFFLGKNKFSVRKIDIEW